MFISGYVTLGNFSCNLYRYKIAGQVAKKIAYCDSAWRDLDFFAVLRPRLRIERAAEGRINTSTISTCWFKKQIVNKEIWETSV